ncbi:MAG: pirin family protein [Miniphocaeibacter sp.]|uniref:pirin family protein n=1 Tax=Miniphocaeibacter sp. TaxID=3100973 RepID=UPI0017BC9D2D|nr:pirin family protein [Gallicola sp.]
MLKRINNEYLGQSDLGWLRSRFHFSFAEYYNPNNINFGRLRVINDDLVKAGKGFTTHPHMNMEIVSYVVDGKLTHADSMGNEHTLTRGQVQYMSAGTGVYHSEMNYGDETLRFLQIWVVPDKNGYTPNYGDFRYNWDDRKNKWLHIVSSVDGDANVKLHQDFNIYVTELDEGKELEFKVEEGRQAYIVQIEGKSKINNIEMFMRDGMEVVEEDLKIEAVEKSHIMILEMNKEQ